MLDSVLLDIHKWNQQLVQAVVPIDQVVQVVAYCLVLSVCFRAMLFKFPFLMAFPLMTFMYNVVVLIQVVSLVAVFFLLPAPVSKLQTAMYSFVVMIAVFMIVHILYRAVMFGYFLIKFRNLSIAISGVSTLMIDNKCYPAPNLEGCIAIKKVSDFGESSYFWGDVHLSSAPQLISYWKWSGPIHYKYYTKIQEGDCVFFIWVREKEVNYKHI